MPHPDRIARLVVDSADDFAIFTTDLKGLITSWSPGAERLLGWTEAEVLGQDACLIFTAEDLAADACNQERSLAQQHGRASDERWHVRNDGSRFFASGLLMRLEESGRHLGYVKILRDRTEVHHANEELLKLHRQSTEILESLSDGFYAVDDQWRFTYVNRRAEEWWGRDRRELLGKVYPEEFPQIVGSIPFEAHATAMRNRQHQHLEALSPLLNRWVEIDIHPTASGGLSVYFSDISERRRREAALENSQQRLRVALGAAKMAIWELDLATQQLTPSAELAAFLNVSPEDLADIEKVRQHYHPEDRDRLRLEGQAALARGELSFEFEFRYYRSRDDLRWFLLRADIRHAEGEPRWVLGALADITGRKTAEQELRRLKDNLEEEVLLRSTELIKAEEALRQSQKMEAIGQLTGGVAHDFNNLLTIIRSSVDLLRRPEFSEERKQKYMTAISETVDRAAKLTSQLLAFARRQSLAPTVFDASAHTNRIAEMLNTVTGARVRVDVAAECSACFVRANATQFETALVNLAVNARDAMSGEGTLSISISTIDRLAEIRGHHGAEDGYVALSVSDTGAGIPEEHLDHIFEPFFTTKDVGKGTGLGLSQVYGFAKQSGGDVEVESRVGVGTTFTLYLPQAAKPESSQEQAPAPQERSEAKLRILVVEDNLQVGEFAIQLLAELGHTATLAGNAKAALRILAERANDFDIIFSDIVMPGMNGIDLAREVRSTYPNLRIVLTSGYSDVIAREGSLEFNVLQKPYSLERLMEFVESGATG